MINSPASGAGSGTGAAGTGIVDCPTFIYYKSCLKRLILCVQNLQNARKLKDLPLVKELLKKHSEAMEDFKKAKSKLPEGYSADLDEREHLLLEYPSIKAEIEKIISTGKFVSLDFICQRIMKLPAPPAVSITDDDKMKPTPKEEEEYVLYYP